MAMKKTGRRVKKKTSVPRQVRKTAAPAPTTLPLTFWQRVGPSAAALVVLLIGAYILDVFNKPMEALQKEMKTLNETVSDIRGDIKAIHANGKNLKSNMKSVQGDIKTIRVDVDNLKSNLTAVRSTVNALHGRPLQRGDLDVPMKHAMVVNQPNLKKRLVKLGWHAPAMKSLKALSWKKVRVMSFYTGATGSLQYLVRNAVDPGDFPVMYTMVASFEKMAGTAYSFKTMEGDRVEAKITKVHVREIDRTYSIGFLRKSPSGEALTAKLQIFGWVKIGRPVFIQKGLSYRGIVQTINNDPRMFATAAN